MQYMVRVLVISVFFLSLFAPVGVVYAKQQELAPVQNISKDDPQMRRAIAKAKQTLPQFLAALADPPPGYSDFIFKYPLAGWEHIWVDHVERHGNVLTGRLSNVPLDPAYRLGQQVAVPLDQVSDWSYRDANGVAQGQLTTRVILPQLDPDDAKAVRRAMGWAD